MRDETLGLVVKLTVVLIFLIFLAGVSVILEHTILNITDIDISAGIHFFDGFVFCQFYNYIFSN